jgi:hypothetical protein
MVAVAKHIILTIGALAFVGNAAASPTSPPMARNLSTESDAIVIGRVLSKKDLQPTSQIITDRTMYHELAVINVATVLKSPSTSLTGKVTVRIHSYQRLQTGAPAIFFLHSAAGWAYVNAVPDHWTLPARQVSEQRGQTVSDPVQGVAHEMVSILGASEGDFTNPATGVNYLDGTMLETRVDAIYAAASQALRQAPKRSKALSQLYSSRFS